MPSQYDDFWKARLDLLRELIKAAREGRPTEADVSEIRQLGNRPSGWSGSARIQGNHLIAAPMAHAKSLGSLVVDQGLCEAYPDLPFKFTITTSCKLKVTTERITKRSAEPRPEPGPENETTEPFSPKRHPVEMTVDLEEGQRGISYDRLFAPYVRGAKRIKIVDPFIRYAYQIHNFIAFCEFIAPEQGNIDLTLITAADSCEQESELSSKLDELKGNLLREHIVFNYKLQGGLHDRFIEADTGWRISLGRGLDIFKRSDRLSLDFVEQTRRRCKGTTIIFTRSKS
jgi:ATP-dependent Lon protease